MPREASTAVRPTRSRAARAKIFSRRHLLRAVFLGLGTASFGVWNRRGAAQGAEGPELSMPFGPLGAADFGPLVRQAVSDHLTGVDHQLFAPKGFVVRVVMRADVNPITLTSSAPLGHRCPDGGAVYSAPDGGWVYVSNSEVPDGGVAALHFDAGGQLIDYRRVCQGTRNNCAGGRTPWGTWITCEEVDGGFAFECDPFGSAMSQRRLDALGARDGREAVAIDPAHHVCYQTMDNAAGKLVRFVSDPDDLEPSPKGVTRMRMQSGASQRLFIRAYAGMPAYDGTVVPNDRASSALLRRPRPIEWVADTGNNGTSFNGAEGIGYHEIPEPLRTTPTAGRVATRGVILFATKGDNRVWAIDVENNFIELIYDAHGAQAFPNLRNARRAPSQFDQVDNVVVSPMGDVLIAEDGDAMRLAVMTNDGPPKLLLQITRGQSEICGPAFTPDGSRLYFSSQRGPSGSSGAGTSGVIYEMTIPSRFCGLKYARS